ncbi:hypothetical protein MA16_Dca009504 [Dendrobium catenatum]|uniref:Uncharacterized protein n=1 Tax=Dendrobium catenatum TaxID=906689 RepID=A0A2I0VRU5_9ASPA|nr:hypothetical protein MA16_Dca009504 [Dendrobium catenatum]
MDPKTILRCSGDHIRIAVTGVISAVAGILFSFTVINCTAPSISIAAGSVSLAVSSSPIITRLVAELKIHKSEIDSSPSAPPLPTISSALP